MIASFKRLTRTAAISLLAAGMLAAGSAVQAADSNQLAWAPNRDDAIIIDGVPSAMLPQESSLSKSLQMQRPRALSRPMPMRSRTYMTEVPIATETLPAITGTPVGPDGLPVPPGSATYYDPAGGMISADDATGDPACNSCCSLFGPCGGCSGCNGGRGVCCWIPICIFIPRPPKDGLEFFGGVQGFTGPANRGGSGSFGFHEGFNWGLPLGGFMAYQFGANWTQSNFDGSFLTPDTRNQLFVTAGLFRRVDWGLQGGVVVDYLHDAWDYNADLLQLRGELSWLYGGSNEIGFWFTTRLNDANNITLNLPTFRDQTGNVTSAPGTASLVVNDIYAFFFRRTFASGGQGRLFGGLSGRGQGLVGADATLPISPNWSLRSNFIYAAPRSGSSDTDPHFMQESWNVGISLVWTPCPRCPGVPNYCRPLFNVADNGSFLTRLVR